MANASIDGLISGLQTSTIISQLMQIEAQPQARLQTSAANEQSVVTAYQAINAALKAAADKANSLNTSSDWDVFTASSSAASVAVTANSTATPGTYAFDVKTTAKPHAVLYGTAANTTSVVAGATIDITQGGTTTSLPVGGTGTLQDVVNSINNNSTLGVRAGLIKVSEGNYRLQLTSKSGGDASQFSVSGLSGLGTAAVTSTGTDATIQIGPDPVNDLVHSSTNTFADVFPGVSFTVTAPETGVTVTVGTDNTALGNNVKGLVDSLNAALAELTKDTAYNATTKTGGVLLGQTLPSRLQNDLRNSVLTTQAGTLAAVGIQLNSSGQITLDTDKLAAALKADPANVTSLVSGFAQRVVDVAVPASRAGGDVGAVIDGRQTLIRSLNDQISEWDTRLADRQSQLQRQYAALETALGALKTQGEWLAGQISSLPSGG